MMVIVAGGQTGADQAALDAAIACGFPHKGWCPKGCIAENGIIPDRFKLQETQTSDYSERTKLNIRDSDGTLIFVPQLPLEITDGTVLTINEAKTKKKAYYIVDYSKLIDYKPILQWIKQHKIHILNVAGPRESSTLGTYQSVLSAMSNLLALAKTACRLV